MPSTWQSIYVDRRCDAALALQAIRSGQRILVGSGCAAPQALLRALVERHDLHDVELVHLLTFGIAPYVNATYENIFRHNAFFIGPNVRGAVGEGRADYTPIFLSEIPRLFSSRQMRLDVAMVMVSQPNRFGYVSLGIHPDIVMAAIDAADVVIAQVNRNMPSVHGDTFVHVSRIDHFVEATEDLLELPAPPLDDVSRAIARHVATLIEDGATLQLGIGKIPNAVLELLTDRRDLGLHTEMFSDGVLELIERGVITNAKKGFIEDKAVASFAMGSRRLYEFLDDNPFFEFHRTEFVNSPRVIAQNRKMVSINSALQVDITGQVCADSIGPNFYSGIGGQVDFIRGSAMSEGGKPIIALPATAKDGALSRIVTQLDAGAGVVTTRGDVHYVVTEHGVAYLHGKTIRERAMALIEIAHPDFREELRRAAVDRKYVPTSWELPAEASRYPMELESREVFQGTGFFVRPLRSSDTDRLMEFFYSHSHETILGRYGYSKASMKREEALQLTTLDYDRRMAIGIFNEDGNQEHLAAVGRYTVNDKTRMAQLGIVVAERYRRWGMGRCLVQRLGEHARQRGVVGFTGVFPATSEMPTFLKESFGHNVVVENGEARYEFRFDERRRNPEVAPTRVTPIDLADDDIGVARPAG
jgi:acyl-CoA hydrolase/GNAT superfamily N-acetyltransferase